jgi:hypothetical protein
VHLWEQLVQPVLLLLLLLLLLGLEMHCWLPRPSQLLLLLLLLQCYWDLHLSYQQQQALLAPGCQQPASCRLPAHFAAVPLLLPVAVRQHLVAGLATLCWFQGT